MKRNYESPYLSVFRLVTEETVTNDTTSDPLDYNEQTKVWE